MSSGTTATTAGPAGPMAALYELVARAASSNISVLIGWGRFTNWPEPSWPMRAPRWAAPSPVYPMRCSPSSKATPGRATSAS